MMTPNLNVIGHWWVRALVRFNFQLEYQKGCDNTVKDVLSWVTTLLDPEMVKSILNGVILRAVYWVEVHNLTIIEGGHGLEQEGCVATGHVLVQMHITDWTEAQREDPVLSVILDWLEVQKKTDLKALLAEHVSSKEGQLILQN